MGGLFTIIALPCRLTTAAIRKTSPRGMRNSQLISEHNSCLRYEAPPLLLFCLTRVFLFVPVWSISRDIHSIKAASSSATRNHLTYLPKCGIFAYLLEFSVPLVRYYKARRRVFETKVSVVAAALRLIFLRSLAISGWMWMDGEGDPLKSTPRIVCICPA